MASLQDQLLKAGLVDDKKTKQINKEKRKQAKQKKGKGQPQVDESKEQAKRTLAEKAEHNRQLNLERNKEADKKAIQAQIKQLIVTNKISREEGEIAYQFTDGKQIKKIYVTGLLQEQLVKGLIAIAKLGQSYELVPAKVAEKIQQRDEGSIVVQNTKAEEVNEDDPYADYKIPDDLMW